jgi:predicted DNA-binding transcriptional regulator AlpA
MGRDGMEQDISPETVRYMTIVEAAEVMQVAKSTVERDMARGEMIPPDVLVLPRGVGWSRSRVMDFAVDSYRLDEDGSPITMGPRSRSRLRDTVRDIVESPKYARKTALYLGVVACGYVLDQGRMTTYFKRDRGVFFPADVLVGKNRHGWKESKVIEFATEDGDMTDEKTARWVVRRTLEFGMPVDTPWVQRYLEDKPRIAKALSQNAEYAPSLPDGIVGLTC